jgi:DNA-binding LacI/PurR family transcriptional regulator
MAERVGWQAIARAARVSVATVSRVANGVESVDPALRERVIKTAAKLGVNLQQRNKSRIIAFLLSNRGVLHTFHSAVLVGAEACCAARDYGLLFLPLRYPASVPWNNLAVPQILQRHEIIRGAIVAGSNSQNLLDLLARRGVPFVVLGNNVVGDWDPTGHDVVWFDDIHGAFEATQHLHDLGHREIWYVGNCRLPWFARRREGYRCAMIEAALEPRVSGIDSENEYEIGYLATKSILGRKDPVSAILAGDDATARGVYQALRDCRLAVPGDVSVAAVNDLEAPVMSPPLTSVRVFPEQVGRQLAELLFNRLEQPDLAPQHRVIPTELARRESSSSIGRRGNESLHQSGMGSASAPHSQGPQSETLQR